jgi:hypothetical protein
MILTDIKMALWQGYRWVVRKSQYPSQTMVNITVADESDNYSARSELCH